jgi:predicted AAA+ superfamily ATPase
MMDFLPRDIQSEMMAMANAYPIVTVLGPRQSGKTTLVRQLFIHKPYVSLENPDDRSFAELDPRGFLEQYPNGAILDEIQRLPILLSYLQGIVDLRPTKGQFILTGSHQHELHQSVSQSLAGRTALLTLLPLCLAELPTLLQNEELDYYLYHGMYPAVYHDALEPTKFYRNYLQTYVERDVRQMIHIKDLSRFQHFIRLCASRVGQLFNASNISQALGVSSNTVHHWLSILEASFVIYRLQPYFENFGKRMIKSPKLYFTDVGLATYCLDIQTQAQLARDPLRGSLAENFVISEFIKHRTNQGLEPNAYFYRDSNQHEIDLLMKQGHDLIPIEIKSSKTFHPEFLNGLRYVKEIAPDRFKSGYLIYAGAHEQRIHDFSVVHFSQTKAVNAAMIDSVQ